MDMVPPEPVWYLKSLFLQTVSDSSFSPILIQTSFFSSLANLFSLQTDEIETTQYHCIFERNPGPTIKFGRDAGSGSAFA